MPKYRKKLIEVDLPIDDINKEALREKKAPGRVGQLSAMHQYWARRPLVVCRAVAFASLVDDPSSCPDEFPTIEDQVIERKRLHDIIRGLVDMGGRNNEKHLTDARYEIARSIARQPGKPDLPSVGGAPPPASK